jgi:hypothetical protein
MRVLHNLVNVFQGLTSSRPNPKMQYPNTKMIYQLQETCESIFDYWPKHRYFILFTSLGLLHTYMWVWQKLANVVMLFILGHMCRFFFCGENPMIIFNIYMRLLWMWVKQTHIGHKWQVHGSQSIWYTKHKHMGHNTYDTQKN